MNPSSSNPIKHRVLIIGGGTGGISVAARLKRQRPQLDVAVIEPSADHYYQPAWTLVGGGSYQAENTRRPLAEVLPRGVDHIQGAVSRLLPDENRVQLEDGRHIAYDWLVVAAGIQINWGAIEGLVETLGKNGVTSNYRYDLAPYTWELVNAFKGGNAIFTQPAGPVKCPGAPQKALYLSADHFRRQGIRADSLQFHSGAGAIFGVPFFARALDQVLESYDAQAHYGSQLVAVRGDEKIAVFERSVDGETRREEHAFDLLHVVPPQSAPDFIRESALANEGGWLDVNAYSLQHVRYNNVFGLGDCTSTPNSKTCAAIKAQAPVLVSRLLGALEKSTDSSLSYEGYAACPLTTSRGKVMLAEFSYGGKLTPSLPLDPRKPRRFYWWLKRSFMPWFYWNRLLKGRDIPVSGHERSFSHHLPTVRA